VEDVKESVEPETVTASVRAGRAPTAIDAALPQHEEPQRVAESGPKRQREQEGDDRRIPWELLLFPVILVVQATWMGFLVYWALRALF
jgi:hypothetical protein